MAIKITYDKSSEFEWLRRVIGSGCLNLGRETVGMFDIVGIPTKQTISYEHSENFIDDIGPALKAYYEKREEEDRKRREEFDRMIRNSSLEDEEEDSVEEEKLVEVNDRRLV
jgi:hypothetical protein